VGAGPEGTFARTTMMNGWNGFLADLAFLRSLSQEDEPTPYEILELMEREKRPMSPFPEELRQPGGPEFFPHPDEFRLFVGLVEAGVPREDIRVVPGGVIVSARSAARARRAFMRMTTAPLGGAT